MKAQSAGARILIIDEADDTREIMSYLFRKNGCTVETAINREEAMAKAPAYRPEIIVFNIVTSENDAFETARRLREKAAIKEVPIIFLSGYAHLSGIAKAFPGERVMHIQKPCNIKPLLREINKLLTRRP